MKTAFLCRGNYNEVHKNHIKTLIFSLQSTYFHVLRCTSSQHHHHLCAFIKRHQNLFEKYLREYFNQNLQNKLPKPGDQVRLVFVQEMREEVCQVCASKLRF